MDDGSILHEQLFRGAALALMLVALIAAGVAMFLGDAADALLYWMIAYLTRGALRAHWKDPE